MQSKQHRENAKHYSGNRISALTMRHVWCQAFKIPYVSMENTLLVGAHILVNKLRCHLTAPQRFDVIVYSYLWEEGRDSIKRIIGLPGDHVYLRNRQIYVNDQPLNEPYSHYTADARQVTFGP